MSGWDLAAVAALVALGIAYLSGELRLVGHGATATRLGRAGFWIGWTTAVAAIVPPLDSLVGERFSLHMVQHELLMLVAVPLMVAGRPFATAVLGLPAPLRRAVGELLRAGAGGVWRRATSPLGAWAAHGTAVWLWHVPALYELAVRVEGVHALEHAMFAGTAGLFWSGVVHGRYGRVGYGAAVFYVFTTLVHTGLLGAVFTLAPSPLYPLYAARTPDALGDQQIAGLVMWVPAGFVLTATGLALFAAWLGESARRARHRGPLGVVR